MKQYNLKKHLNRISTFYSFSDKNVPKELFEIIPEAPDLSGISLPLPCKKSSYTCYAKGNNDVLWLGSGNGLTRLSPNAERYDDRVMYFSASRDLPDNNVTALLAENNNVWVLTGTHAVHIEMILLSAEEKADILLKETLDIVMRRGMVSQRELLIPGNLSSRYPYASSDNDGGFTAAFSIGEMFHYAVLKKELGENDPKTIEARLIATKSCEACLLLMYIHGRGDGFIARTYLTPDEKIPDDGLFFRRDGNYAVCLKTREAVKQGFVGKRSYCGAHIPERLRKHYTELGYNDDGIVYKGDTSSDEVSLHFLQMKFAYDILVPNDKELGDIIIDACKNSMNHIIDNGYNFCDFTGEPTTWAKWSPEYFKSGTGWIDAPLNAAELLMLLKITMYITNETDKWQQTYDKLIKDGYAELTTKHYERFYQGAVNCGCDPKEDLMYGDHMLAVCSFWGLIELEKDKKLLSLYKKGCKSWRTTLKREHNPGYDFPYAISCPDDEIDMEKIATWFYRTNISRLASGVTLSRHDIPVKPLRGGEYEEISTLLAPDERFISKFDRCPLCNVEEESGGEHVVESCYVYTLSYWMGRYYGFLGKDND